MGKIEQNLLVDWALALDCAGKWEEAVAKLQQALLFRNTAHVHSQIAAVYANHRHVPEALQELDIAEKLDPSYDATYLYRGNIYLADDPGAAAREYQHALTLNPRNELARKALDRISR
jgi:tetratricopeptide (TPR) repeat protein